MDNKVFQKENDYQNPFNDDFLTSLNNDYGNYNLNTNENEDEFLSNLNTELNMNYFPEKKNNDNTFMFSNSMIQNSILKQNNLKKILVINYLSKIGAYFNKWRNTSKISENNPPFQNQFIIEKLLNSNNVVNNFILEKKSSSVSKDSSDYDVILKRCKINSKERCLSKLFTSQINGIYSLFYNNMKLSLLKKKVIKAYLSLFITHSNGKMKLKRIQNEVRSSLQKTNDYEKKINKLEQNLNEKASIITKKNDTIETLTEQIENLTKKVKNLESKKGHFNVIHESLCSKCSNSLEESYISTTDRHKNMNLEIENQIMTEKINSFLQKENDFKKTIQEQLDYILKLEQENKDLRSKNIEYKAKNETVIKELENIKEDFRGLSQNFSKKTNLNNIKDTFTQTDEIKKSISSSNKTKSKSKPKIKAKKENTTNKKPVLSNNNIKPLEESTNSSKTNKSTSLDSSRSDKELIQNLKYDNSLLTQEIVNLNKELMKLRNDSKLYNETLRKIEKEKNELKAKFSSKFDNYEKIKKENEELMIMIQTSNYKTVYSIDNENKKLKDEINLIKQELENIKQETLLKEKRFKETENDFEQNKKNIEMINKFKGERENLILENTKLDSEIKKIRFEIEDIKKICEKQEIIMRNKEETNAKLTQDLNYLSISAKKSKQEAERAIQDALGFQQIVRKIEKELNDVQIKKEKAENELNLFKQQFLKNKY